MGERCVILEIEEPEIEYAEENLCSTDILLVKNSTAVIVRNTQRDRQAERERERERERDGRRDIRS